MGAALTKKTCRSWAKRVGVNPGVTLDLELYADRYEAEQQALEECQQELFELPPPHFNACPEWPTRPAHDWKGEVLPF